MLADEERMRLRYAGVCRVCGIDLPARGEAIYERSSRTVRCITHDDRDNTVEVEVTAIDIGTPGASARREFERRKAGRERRIRAKHPKIGRFLHANSDKPQTTTA